MAGYKQQDLIDGETLIKRDLLQPMQDALSTAVYAVLTVKEMDNIRSGATETGGYYMYLGESAYSNIDTSFYYKKGAVYTVEEA